MPEFKCHLCKQTKRIQEAVKMLFWNTSVWGDVNGTTICSLCTMKLQHIIKESVLNKNQKQQLIDNWGLYV